MTDNITLPRATVQQTLEALEELDGLDSETECVTIDVGDVMDALRTALEQQQAEPVEGNTLLKAFLASAKEAGVTHLQQAEPVQEPFDGLATELFVVAQISPADDGFSDTIDRIESWLREHFSAPPQRKPLTEEEIRNAINTFKAAENLMGVNHIHVARAIEAAHGIKEGT